MAPVLTKGLTNVRAEFNATFGGRDKKSDGWIGDYKHSTGSSGHNPDKTGKGEYRDGDSKDEVRAIDVDKDLRDASGRGVTMERVVQYILTKLRAGVYMPFRYIIFNRRIWTRSNGWRTQDYTGPNGHTEHAHFSGDFTEKADEWTGKLGLAALTAKVTAPKPSPSKPGTLPVHANGSRVNSKDKNNVGTDVATLQRFIGDRTGTPDGNYGDKTTSGVKWYQKEILGLKGNDVDGIAGPKTWGPVLKAIR